MRADAAPAFLWLPGLRGRGQEFALESDDAHYVARVCRAEIGDTLSATDGEGALATLEVLAVRGETRVRIRTLRDQPRPGHAIVACGAPEKDRADWLVEKLGELGVADLQPLECERAGWERFDSRRDRLERLAVAALRQSRRAWRLVIREPLAPAAWCAGLEAGGERWLADAEGRAARLEAGPWACVAVGPAPGFSASERASLGEAGFVGVRLSEARLRTETAALGWAALWSVGCAAKSVDRAQ